jgi:hypothetical protein
VDNLAGNALFMKSVEQSNSGDRPEMKPFGMDSRKDGPLRAVVCLATSNAGSAGCSWLRTTPNHREQKGHVRLVKLFGKSRICCLQIPAKLGIVMNCP